MLLFKPIFVLVYFKLTDGFEEKNWYFIQFFICLMCQEIADLLIFMWNYLVSNGLTLIYLFIFIKQIDTNWRINIKHVKVVLTLSLSTSVYKIY